MNWTNLKLVQRSISINSIKSALPQASALFVILIIFVGNIAGIIEFGANNATGIDLHPEALTNTTAPFSIPKLFGYEEFVLLLISGILLSLFLPIMTPIGACLLVALLAIPPIYIGVTQSFRETPLPMQYSLLVLMVLFGINVLINYFAEARKKQKMLDVFGRFIPPEIANQLTKQSDLLNLEGQSKELTVFFCDLINFTQLSEQLSPRDIVKLLNEYFTVMTEVLYEQGATIDKYMGDCVMAFWGAPIPQEDHAHRAVIASFEIQKRLKTLAQTFEENGWPAPSVGIGINTGVMNVGNMGSKYRLAYTVIGDAVNLAFRLEDLSRTYNAPAIVGEGTINAAKDIVFKELDAVTVRGKSNMTRIYQPVCLRSELTAVHEQELKNHHSAMENYYAKRYGLALKQFEELKSESESIEYYQHMINISRDRMVQERSQPETSI